MTRLEHIIEYIKENYSIKEYEQHIEEIKTLWHQKNAKEKRFIDGILENIILKSLKSHIDLQELIYALQEDTYERTEKILYSIIDEIDQEIIINYTDSWIDIENVRKGVKTVSLEDAKYIYEECIKSNLPKLIKHVYEALGGLLTIEDFKCIVKNDFGRISYNSIKLIVREAIKNPNYKLLLDKTLTDSQILILSKHLTNENIKNYIDKLIYDNNLYIQANMKIPELVDLSEYKISTTKPLSKDKLKNKNERTR